MRRPPDLLEILDLAYRTDLDDAAWLAGICDGLRRAVDARHGCAGFRIDASNLSAVRIGKIERVAIDVPLDDRAFLPADTTEARTYYSGDVVANTASGQVGGDRNWRATRLYRDVYHPAGVEDVLGVVALDAERRGCVFGLLLEEVTRISAAEALRLTRLGAHVSAALRLRSGRGGEARAPEAVFEPGGKLVHAEGPAKEGEGRSALREMAVRLDRARTQAGREDPDAALEVWTALVSGRWSLVDQFDSDGKRFVVAHKNPPHLVEPHALDERERAVAASAALGRSGKTIAYELGLSQPTVSRTLRSAMDKLGVRSPAELASSLASFVPDPTREPPRSE